MSALDDMCDWKLNWDIWYVANGHNDGLIFEALGSVCLLVCMFASCFEPC